MSSIVEKFDPKHKCLTPGTIYHTEIHGNTVTMTMDLPKNISISGDEKFQLKLEANLHYAIEAVLAELFDFNAKAKETRTVRLTAGRAEWK